MRPGSARKPLRPSAPVGSRLPPGKDAVEMMSAVAGGDEAAFGRLYDLVAPRVYGLIVRVLRNRALTEEVAQEVIIEAWRTAGRFDATRGSVTGWVLTIAQRRAVDRIRAEQASTSRMMKFGLASVPIAYDEVVDEVTDRLRYQQVRNCLDCLTDLQRQAVVLAYYDGHTYREVADLLTVAVPTVKSRMRDALIRLRDCLGPSA